MRRRVILVRVKKEFSSPEAADLARWWKDLPVGTLVRNTGWDVEFQVISRVSDGPA